MKFNQWTLGLAAVGAVSLASAVRADEAKLSAVQTALSNTTISGYVDVAAQYNLGNIGDYGYPGGGTKNGFTVNAVNVVIEKPLDESRWASGYRIEMQYGDNSWDGIRQAYVALRTPVGNGIDWKIGQFDGVTGYESNSGYQNPNYTFSYGYNWNPATLTGLIGSYKIGSFATVQAGIVNRVSNGFYSGEWINPGQNHYSPSSKSYVATVALTAPDSWGFLKGSVLNLGTVQGFDNGAVNNYSANVTLNTPVAGLKVGLSYDAIQSLTQSYYGGQNVSADGNIYGVYATYQATDKLSFSVRGEYVDSTDLGVFSSTYNGGSYPPYADTVGNGRGNGKGEEVTATIAYNLWANVITRLEFRWDHTESGTQYATATSENSNENAFLLALNVIYKF